MFPSKSKYFSFFAVIFLAMTMSQSILAKETFQLKGDREVGSRMKPVDAESNIPFDKTYDELTEDQKQLFRASYGGLKDTEKPPFPLKGMQAIYKPIIKGHKEIGTGGMLFLVAIVDEAGKVENLSVYETPANATATLATNVLFNVKFEPGTCDGSPCKMEFPFEFKLRDLGRTLRSNR